ncbi:anti-sigma factor RsiW [Aeromicrobium panaciterrae]|uniref:Regulator of SigK n=1 Tax=Aeromicrobium panaciterrae TaxID=363861 RepID=A0ABU1UP17_9ACTN|nr:anti-sigma factor [Aeromicrobium panaciterrae]MDR7086885.1 anti-sigma factor RsiW [Aeromicrobium panaciterrae]
MTEDLHSLIAPYSLDALDPAERARFEAHLTQCTSCQSELSGFVATAARLGDVESMAPPAGLRDRLMSEVSTTRQERPTVVALNQSRLRRTLPRLAMAAAFLVGAVGVGGFLNERDNAHDLRAQSETITSIVSADDAETIDKTFDGGGHVRMISSAETDAAFITAKDLPGLEDGKVYQVWVVTDDSPASQGYFATSGEMVMEDLDGADRIAITVEPKGGSKQPTTAPIATLAV